jgi:hypothetical protein
MFTGIPAVDTMISVIIGAVVSIIFAAFFIFGFYQTATPATLLGLN